MYDQRQREVSIQYGLLRTQLKISLYKDNLFKILDPKVSTVGRFHCTCTIVCVSNLLVELL